MSWSQRLQVKLILQPNMRQECQKYRVADSSPPHTTQERQKRRRCGHISALCETAMSKVTASPTHPCVGQWLHYLQKKTNIREKQAMPLKTKQIYHCYLHHHTCSARKNLRLHFLGPGCHRCAGVGWRAGSLHQFAVYVKPHWVHDRTWGGGSSSSRCKCHLRAF